MRAADQYVTDLSASGGVGLAAVDVAVALGPCPVVVGGSLAKLDIALNRYAVATVDDTNDDVKVRLNELTDGAASVVIHPVPVDHMPSRPRAMRWGGR